MNHDVIITCALTGAGDTSGRSPLVPVTPKQIAEAAVEAAKAGLGVALMPRFFVLSEIASGELVVPCPHVLRNRRSYYLVYPEDKQGSESLQSFCAWLREQARRYRDTDTAV